MPKIISIEGNIGAGKTTILDNLKEYLKHDKEIIVLKEPVDIWESIIDIENETILQKFYKNPLKHAFTFQVMAFVTRLSILRKTVKENPQCKLIICERSLEADRHIFAKMLYDDDLIEDINYKIYLKFYEEYKNDFQLDGIIYIDADAEVCFQRIAKRGRNGEEGVTLDYLKNCKKYHDEWLLKNDKVLQIKTNNDVHYENNDLGIVWLNEINDYIEILLEKQNNWFSVFFDYIITKF